jgi:uncharacterized membrane protein YhaH (DUF805 family)
MGFFEAVASVFSKYFEFSGRALRSEYWYFSLFVFLAAIPVSAVSIFMPPVYFIYILVIAIPGYAVAVRRLHDSNVSGWWLLITLIPLIGLFIFYWLIKKGDTSENRFGMLPIGSRSNNSAAARAARPREASSSTDSSRGESSTASRAAREASSSTDSPRGESSTASIAAREASSSTDSSRGDEAVSTKPAEIYFDNRKSPPKEPAKKQEKPSKDTSSEIDDIFFDNRRKK